MKKQGVLQRFATHPAVALISFVSAIVGIGLAILFYYWGRQTRDLVYAVHPVRTVLAQKERPTGLKIEFMGEEIRGSDVVAVQVALWNQGTESIRPANVLSPAEIHLVPPSRVLEVSIQKGSRPVTKLDNIEDKTAYGEGRVPLRWDILERGDGGSFQIVYEGSPDSGVQLSGIIEGQGAPRELRSSRSYASPVGDYLRDVHAKRLGNAVAIGGMAVAIAAFGVAALLNYMMESRATRVVVMLGMYIALMGTIVVVSLLFQREVVPPFGF